MQHICSTFAAHLQHICTVDAAHLRCIQMHGHCTANMSSTWSGKNRHLRKPSHEPARTTPNHLRLCPMCARRPDPPPTCILAETANAPLNLPSGRLAQLRSRKVTRPGYLPSPHWILCGCLHAMPRTGQLFSGRPARRPRSLQCDLEIDGASVATPRARAPPRPPRGKRYICLNGCLCRSATPRRLRGCARPQIARDGSAFDRVHCP